MHNDVLGDFATGKVNVLLCFKGQSCEGRPEKPATLSFIRLAFLHQKTSHNLPNLVMFVAVAIRNNKALFFASLVFRLGNLKGLTLTLLST